jgi:sirohydrochlorin ferrochelatase
MLGAVVDTASITETQPARPTLLAVAHGTRNPAGIAVIEALVELVRDRLRDVLVQPCFVDVAEPSLVDALAAVSGPAVIVPVLLSTGYHVTSDIPSVTAGRPATVVTAPLGPDPRVSEAALARLDEARGSTERRAPLVVVAAGSSDPQARVQLGTVGGHVERAVGRPVAIAQLTDPDPLAGVPASAEVVNYLLAPGYFDDQLRVKAGGRLVADPIGAHPLVADVIVARFLGGESELAAGHHHV